MNPKLLIMCSVFSLIQIILFLAVYLPIKYSAVDNTAPITGPGPVVNTAPITGPGPELQYPGIDPGDVEINTVFKYIQTPCKNAYPLMRNDITFPGYVVDALEIENICKGQQNCDPFLKESPFNISNLPANISKIPLRLIQTHPTGDLSPNMRKLINSWNQDIAPENMTLYNDDQALEFVKKYYRDYVVEMFDNILMGVIKSDLFRILSIYAIGGIYADTDIERIQPISNWLSPEDDCVIGVELYYKEDLKKCQIDENFVPDPLNIHRFQNWAFAFTARNIFMKNVLVRLFTNYRNKAFIFRDFRHIVHNTFGPGSFTDAIKNSYRKGYNCKLLSHYKLGGFLEARGAFCRDNRKYLEHHYFSLNTEEKGTSWQVKSFKSHYFKKDWNCPLY